MNEKNSMFWVLKKIHPAYVSKHNSNREKQIILLMIPNEKGCKTKCYGREADLEGQQWYFLAVKETIRIIKGNKVWTLCWFLLSELISLQKTNLNGTKMYVRIRIFLL